MFQQNKNPRLPKRTYNEMKNNPIHSSSSSQDDQSKKQEFKSVLKFAGPINQDLILHHDNNLRKSMLYKQPPESTFLGNITHQKEKEIQKKEKYNDLRDFLHFNSEKNKIKSEENNNILNRTKSKYNNDIIKFVNNLGFKADKKITNFENIFSNNMNKEKDVNIPINIKQNNEQANPTNSSNISSMDKNNIENNCENKIVKNPFLPNPEKTIGNPFKETNPFLINNFNNNNNSIINPFNPNNDNIINPFSSSKKNPFSSNISNNDKNTEVNNQFLQNNNNTNNYNNNVNPFNPFLPSNNKTSNNNNNDINNPFKNFVNNNNTNNFFNNPFINNNNNSFISNMNVNPFQNNNNNKLSNNDETDNQNEDENINVEEEIKIEKDENKLKNFKEVKFEINKFYEIKIENLQYLEREDNKNKYVSIGEGMLSFQVNKEGKKNGILVLRDINTKNIKIQAIISASSSVEKAQLKNGLEFIMIKNVLAIYSKYNKENIIQKTNLTYIRIRVDKDNIENLLNKAKEFFELMKK